MRATVAKPMPWQELIAMVGGELLDDGTPAYREVVVTVPRQAGKTMSALGIVEQRAVGWGGPQRISYSAQTGNDARKKLVEDWIPILEPIKAKLGIRQLLRGMGAEGIVWRNGSRLGLLASAEESGHGKTVDLAIKDELFADYDDRRDQALIPAMATRPLAQAWTFSTAGTDASIPLLRAVERGRAAVEAGVRSGVAYFEWSAPMDADPDDPAVWWAHHPALGYTITEDVIRQARASMPDGEFRRAFLNQWTRSEDRVIPADVWAAACSPDAAVEPERGVAFAVDANPERSAAAIFVSDGTTVEQAEFRPGTGWVVERLVEMAQRWSAPVGLDPAGPAGVFVRELERAGVKVVDVAGRDMLQACGAFYDAVTERRVTIRTSGDLDAAVAGAVRRQVGDAWAWARRSSAVDVCPLVAATLAFDVAGREPAPVHQWF